jgi:hypothetical protein
MPRPSVTYEQFTRASRRSDVYGNLAACATLYLIGILEMLVVYRIGPSIGSFGNWIQGRGQNGGAAGLIGGLVFGTVAVPPLALAVLPVLWADRRFGLKCPACGRSVTLNNRRYEVTRTGRCCKCQEQLLDAAEFRIHAEARTAEYPRIVGKFLLGWAGIAWGCFLLSLVPFRQVCAPLEVAEAAFLTLAMISCLIVAVASAWASLRTRRRSCYAAAVLTTTLAPLVVYRFVLFH